MEHLRIVAPKDRSRRVVDLLVESPAVCNVVLLEGVARKPDGDVILADVAREDTSVVLSDLKELDIHKLGSISLELIDTQLSEYADRATHLASGSPADAVIWEEVEENSSEQVELSGAFLVFMVLAALLAAVGIFLDSPITIVGAMVVGPEFGPIAGICVAFVQRRGKLAARSAIALATGFPLAIFSVFLATLVFKATGVTPETFGAEDHDLAKVIAEPDFFAFFIAACAGAAGMLSLSTAKSGALIGVLISVTTIPAASNIGIGAAYGDGEALGGSLAQLGINLGAILLAGTATLWVQKQLYRRRRIKHLADPVRGAAGLPVGRSMHSRRSRR